MTHSINLTESLTGEVVNIEALTFPVLLIDLNFFKSGILPSQQESSQVSSPEWNADQPTSFHTRFVAKDALILRFQFSSSTWILQFYLLFKKDFTTLKNVI